MEKSFSPLMYFSSRLLAAQWLFVRPRENIPTFGRSASFFLSFFSFPLRLPVLAFFFPPAATCLSLKHVTNTHFLPLQEFFSELYLKHLALRHNLSRRMCPHYLYGGVPGLHLTEGGSVSQAPTLLEIPAELP